MERISQGEFTREFYIKGATHTPNKEVIWLCRFYGEPFEVTPIESSATRKKLWKDCSKYFGRKLRVNYTKQTKRGVPTENITGTFV
jgi:hypothetical protein|nr:MAG TPA: hypothetical protein [Caudoviricetes sp.]